MNKELSPNISTNDVTKCKKFSKQKVVIDTFWYFHFILGMGDARLMFQIPGAPVSFES